MPTQVLDQRIATKASGARAAVRTLQGRLITIRTRHSNAGAIVLNSNATDNWFNVKKIP